MGDNKNLTHHRGIGGALTNCRRVGENRRRRSRIVGGGADGAQLQICSQDVPF